jgi:hypothetical protein
MRPRHLSALLFVLLVALASFGQGAPQRAGEVSALLPAAQIERGAAPPLQARIHDPLFWRDWFETDTQARARLALLDGSLLNVGSAARLQVLEHDQASERTELELQFGKVRADVKERTQKDARFQVRTNSAVVGVIGTHLYIDAAAALTTVMNFDGQVRVANADPAVTGEEVLEPFELAEIEPGQPPRKRWATIAELLKALEDTLPGLVTRLVPQQARAGSCISATSNDALSGPVEMGSGAQAVVEIAPRGCAGPDITPVRVCVPETARPGVVEFAVQAADGAQRWGAFLVEPPAPLQDAWLLTGEELPVGATHTARLVGRENQPLPDVPIRVRQGGEEKTVRTDAEGAFALTAREKGTIEIEVPRGPAPGATHPPPFEPLQPIRVAINVVDKVDEKPDLPEYSHRGTLVTLPGEVESAQLGDLALPVLRTVTRSGRTLSSLAIPRDLAEGGKSLNWQESGGQQRSRALFVYQIMGGRLDQNALTSGQPTQGEFFVCVGGGEDKPKKVRARILAVGPVHFRGKGAKGKTFEDSFATQPSGLLRIPFQIQAEKGAPGVGIPFSLSLRLQRD